MQRAADLLGLVDGELVVPGDVLVRLVDRVHQRARAVVGGEALAVERDWSKRPVLLWIAVPSCALPDFGMRMPRMCFASHRAAQSKRSPIEEARIGITRRVLMSIGPVLSLLLCWCCYRPTRLESARR
jgi:hypothetical protein